MELYSLNEYGNYVPFDIEGYTEEVRRAAYTKAREKQRERARKKKEIDKQKKLTFMRRMFGVIMLLLSLAICKLMVAIGEPDVTYMCILIPVSLAFIFAKE